MSSLYLVGRLFRFTEGAPPAKILRAFFWGEAVKILLTVALMTLAIVFLDVDILLMLLGFVLTLPVYWFALLMSATPGKR